jgi:hypothetical protein
MLKPSVPAGLFPALLALPVLVPGREVLAPAGPERVLVVEQRDGSSLRLTPAELRARAGAGLGGIAVRPEGFEAWTPSGPAVQQVVLELVGGDRLYGRVAGGQGEILSVRLLGDAVLPVDVAEMRSLLFPHRLGADRLLELQPAAEGDRLYQKTPGGLDRIDGTVESFDAEGVRFEGPVGSRLYPWEQVAGLYVVELEPDGPEPDESDTRVLVDLADGGRLRAALVGFEPEALALRIASGYELSLPLGTVAGVTIDDGSVAYLSARAPDRETGGQPFGDDLGMRWPAVLDGCVHRGLPLVAGGTRVARGIGCLAPSRLAWDLDGSWSLLRGSVAIDDSALRNAAGARGTVRFRILVDGEERWASPVRHGGEPPLAFPDVDLDGARELVLETDPVDSFAGDRADWLRMLLVR